MKVVIQNIERQTQIKRKIKQPEEKENNVTRQRSIRETFSTYIPTKQNTTSKENVIFQATIFPLGKRSNKNVLCHNFCCRSQQHKKIHSKQSSLEYTN